MKSLKNHPDYEYLQEKLEKLRKSISEKKKQAQEKFSEIITYLESNLGADIPEDLKQELQEIKAILSKQKPGTGKIKENDIEAAELTTEDILQAISAMLNSTNHELNDEQIAAINAEKLRKELRNVIANRMATKASNLPEVLRNIAQADDIISLLNKPILNSICKIHGGAEAVLDKAITVAESRLSALDKITNLGEQIGVPTKPEKTTDSNQFNKNEIER